MITILFKAMAKEEGYGLPDSLATRCSNPLNLRFAGQEGAVCSECETSDATKPCKDGKETHGIAWFDTRGRGTAAGYRQLAKHIQSGLTLRQLIYTWAPSTENNSVQYLTNIQLWTNLPLDDKVWNYIQ